MKESEMAWGNAPAPQGYRSAGASSPAGGGVRAPAAHLGRLSAWALAFGCAVGWGSFVMPGTTFLPKAGPLGTVIGMFIGGLVMTVFAWNYHAMMNRNPGPGGAYTYATKAFGIDHGFICAWFLILAYVAIVWANATALAIVAHYTLGDVFQFGFHYHVAGFDVWMGDIILAAVKRTLGPAGVAVIGIAMFGAIFTGLVGNIFAASRLLAAMADDGILLKPVTGATLAPFLAWEGRK